MSSGLKITGFVLLFALGTKAQYIFRNVNENHGLSSNEATCILRDKKGFLWIGTRDGLNRFDGTECLQFMPDPPDSNSISDNIIKSLYEDHSGTIWVGTRNGGLSRLNPSTLKFISFSHNDHDSLSIANDFINFTFEDLRGNLWVSCFSNGIDLFHPQNNTFSHFNPVKQLSGLIPRLAADILCYTSDPVDEDIYWFGSQQGLLLYDMRKNEWKHFPLNESNTENPGMISGVEQIIRCLMFDQQGCLWAGTWGGGLFKFNPVTGRFRIFKIESMYPVNGIRNNIKQLYPKSGEEFWVMAPNKGIAVFNIRTEKFDFIITPENTDNILTHPYQMIIDSLGFFYAASLTRGLFYTNLKSHQFQRITLDCNITDLGLSPDKNLLFGACAGQYGKLMVYDLKKQQDEIVQYKPVVDIAENYFTGIVATNERVWLIENNMLYYWDSHLRKVIPYHSFDPSEFPLRAEHPHFFISAVADQRDRIWIGSKYSGLFVIDPSTVENLNFYEADDAFGSIKFEDWIFNLFRDSRNRIWYGTDDFGYFDPVTGHFVNYSDQGNIRNAPIKLKKIAAYAETPDSLIWVGTQVEGVAVLDMSSDTPAVIKSYSRLNGLPDNQVIDMASDKEGNVWIITKGGLSMVSRKDGILRNFDRYSGIEGVNCIEISDNGEIYLGGTGAVYRFKPEEIHFYDFTPRLYIKSFRVYDDLIDPGKSKDRDGNIRLKYNQDFISFEYGAIDYFQPEQTRYYYMLEGIDADWHDAGDKKYISYANLPGGFYNFRLKTNKGGELQVPLRISTPFWKTWWFFGLITLTIVFVAIILHRYRLSQIRREEELKSAFTKKISELEVKALRAQMNPHFLFNSLNSIRFYILKNQNENASEYITKFSRLLRMILNNSRQNRISLEEELSTLKIYLDFEQMRFDKKFEYHIHIDNGIETEKVQVQPMTIQPFVENAIWHGLMPKQSDRKLFIKIFDSDTALKIIVEDNGIGREHSREQKKDIVDESKSYGLQITEDRMNMMNRLHGKNSGFAIEDLYDEGQKPLGTRVTITIEN